MGRSQLNRLKELEKENQRLRRAVSDLILDRLILIETASGNVWDLRVVANATIMFGRSWECPNPAPAACFINIDQRNNMGHKAGRMHSV